MATQRRENLKNLLLSIPDNGIVCAAYLCKEGLSHDNLKQYVQHGYLDSLGRGAYCKHNQHPNLASALHALAFQLNHSSHLGGRAALARQGLLHFLPYSDEAATIYTRHNTRLPAWFKKSFGEKFICRGTNFLPRDLAIETKELDGFSVPSSMPERAILEYLLDVPTAHPLNEAYQVMEMMTNTRPDILQQLLESCSSIKVKRLFFLLADDLHYAWYDDLDQSKIDLGSGCRIIDKGGTYQSKWNVIVKDWKEI